jgi:hypothetical protein
MDLGIGKFRDVKRTYNNQFSILIEVEYYLVNELYEYLNKNNQ